MRADELSTRVASWWRWPLLAGIVLLATLGAMAATQYSEFTRATADIEHSDAVTRAVDHLVLVLVDAETGYRGYLLTGNPVFLEPYRGVDGRARDAVVALTSLLADDTSRRGDLSRLSALVDQRLAEMTSNIAFNDQGQRERALASIRTATGKRLMDNIRLVGGTLKSEQRTLTASRSLQEIGRAHV